MIADSLVGLALKTMPESATNNAVHVSKPAIAATWLAFGIALALALPQPPKPAHIAAGVAVGAVLIVLGFLIASRCRALPEHRFSRRAKLGAASLVAGSILGAGLLSVLLLASRAEPALRARFAGRLHEPHWRPWALAFESSILEEIVFRLFFLSVVYWVAGRLLSNPRSVFAVALAGSALLFGAAHLPAWFSVAHAVPFLVVAVLLLNGIGGVLFGWVFWRWGLPYAILCHFAGDVVIQTMAPRFLGT